MISNSPTTMRVARLSPLGYGFLACTMFAIGSVAHEHHDDKIPEGGYISPDPLDTTLWIHILIQISAWGIIFPTGMVLGIVRSRWHVPLQTVGIVLAIAGYILGHKHQGRQFAPNIHAAFANSLGFMLAVQILIGIYLKLHFEKGFLGRIRRPIVVAHGVMGKVMPVVSWVQMLFGGITAMGYCRDDHLGQCLAHFIMGSAFIGYGIMLTILLLVGQLWLRRTGRSQEFFDSIVIAAWGCVNTFTEHRWGQEWRGNDLQHTSMGIVWWCAGLLGMWMSRKRDGRAKRNLIPAIVILMTGWAMSAHPQSLELSTHVHSVFGYTLMAAGAVRIIEIAFVLKDRAGISSSRFEDNNSFQHLPPFLLYASGFLFMGATEEQLALLSSLGVTHVSYILLLYSVAFLLYLFVNMLLYLYASNAWPVDKEQQQRDKLAFSKMRAGAGRGNGDAINGTTLTNGHSINGGPGMMAMAGRDRERVKDAEEFELTGLIGEDVEEGEEDALGLEEADAKRRVL